MQGSEDAGVELGLGLFNLFGEFFNGHAIGRSAALHDADNGPVATTEDGADGGREVGRRIPPGDNIRAALGVAEFSRRGEQVYLCGPQHLHEKQLSKNSFKEQLLAFSY